MIFEWIDTHESADGTQCFVWGPQLDELDSPVCRCGHELTSNGEPVRALAPLHLQGRVRVRREFPEPVGCPYWSDLQTTAHVSDGWGRGVVHVRILGPRNQDGTPVTSGPISTRDLQAWLGPAYRDAATVAQTIADTAAERRQGRLTTSPLPEQARADVREWLLGQWRQHANAQERASEGAWLDHQADLANRRAQRAQS